MRDNQNYWKKERESMNEIDFLEYKRNFETKLGIPTTPHKRELKNKSLAFIEYANNKHSLTNGLTPLKDTGLQNISGTVAAFGDFNSDKFTDIVVLDSTQKSISIYLWDHESNKFSKANSSDIEINDFLITNVIPGDYNYDGNLDLLLMGQTNPSTIYRKNEPLYMRVYFGYDNATFNLSYADLESSYSQHPITFDFDGDMKTDLLGHYFSSTHDSKLFVWKNVYNESTGTLFEVVPLSDNMTMPQKGCRLSEPHSNAFIDLNGDCLSDLFLTCEENFRETSYQIWVNTKDHGYVLTRYGELPTYADGDGTIDMVFPVCKKSECAIHIAYNKQKPLCSSKDETNCRKLSNLCEPDDDFRFNLNDDPDNDAYTIIDVKDLLDGGVIVIKDKSFKGMLPVPIRIGDYNMDGFPDLLVISEKGTEHFVSLLESIPCTLEYCDPLAVKAQRRAFVKVIDGANSLNEITNAKGAAFFDVDEDGTLDIMVLADLKSNDAARDIYLINNDYFNDAFFLKTLVLNGVSQRQHYGVNYPGSAFKFTVVDTYGNKRANQVAQYSQVGYLYLQTPYTLFGLGRTNNYVEELFVGVVRNQSYHYTSYFGVIPNSQLIIIPYQPDDYNDIYTWALELYIHPGDWIPWVLTTLATATVILATIVAALHWMEKRR
ncbi:7606_t:CDS:10 [Entrophospora sp. SA101]|nr:7606_t:CDS:10 [Entrophospora sp. SA101]